MEQIDRRCGPVAEAEEEGDEEVFAADCGRVSDAETAAFDAAIGAVQGPAD
jgi:hypothetical protein